MRRRSPALRASALLGPAALAVHELRYLAGWGDDAEHALASHGHSYLGVATPLILLSLAVGVSAFLARLARGGEAPAGQSAGIWRLWLSASAALLAIYVSQELVEGAFAPGHPEGLAGAFGNGGWIALPLATLFGALVTLLLRGAEAVLAHAAARVRTRPTTPPPPPAARPASQVVVRARTGLSTHLAGRAPPLPAS